MFEDDLTRQLLHDARFAALPLLDGDGVFAGLHLHRAVPGGVVDVIQVWTDERELYHAAHARVRNTFSPDAPFAPPAALVRVSGRLGDIAEALLLPPGQRLPVPPE
ncbi:hypothetical protein AB0425_16865 [Actinosynnema sp. NPDC051121]